MLNMAGMNCWGGRRISERKRKKKCETQAMFVDIGFEVSEVDI